MSKSTVTPLKLFFQSMIQCMYSPTQGTHSLKEDTDQEIDQSLLEAGLKVINRNQK